MSCPQNSGWIWELRAYIGATGGRQATAAVEF
jgi:hypothetical protein